MSFRRNFLLCLVPVACTLSGCGGDSGATKVPLLFGSKEYTSETEITPTSHMKKLEDQSVLESMVERGENFLLVVLGDAHETCGCWNTFHQNNIVRFQQETSVLFHYLYSNEITKDFGLDIGSQKATVAIFRDGEVAYQNFDVPEDSDFYRDYASFRRYMLDRITLPRVHYLTRDQLSALYDGVEPFTIYFSRQTCGDCAYMQKTSYRAYYESHPEGIEDSYVIDMDDVGIGAVKVDGVIYHKSTSENANAYQKEAQALYDAFKVEYGLDEAMDNPSGYGTGYVPTLYHVNPEGNGKKRGDVIDMSGVFYNDRIEDGKIADTYFTEERLGLESLSYLRDSHVETKVLLGQEVASSDREGIGAYHDPILNAFLDAAVGTIS